MKKIIQVLALAFISTCVFSQKAADVSLELLDGNIIKGTTLLTDVELITSYGKLLIPIIKVSHIEIGIGRDNAIIEKAKSYIKILNTTTNEDTRNGAYKDLVKLGIKAIPAFTDYYNDPKSMSEETDYAGEFTSDNALTELKDKFNINGDLPTEDVLNIDNYTMGGTYNFAKLDVKTEYGTLSIPKEKIKSVDVSLAIEAGKGEQILKLNASKHISGNTNGGWLKTGIMIKSGQKFTVTATGEVTLASLSGNKYKPDGSVKSKTATDYTGSVTDGENYDGGSSYSYPSYGQVVYHIGETTESLKIGAKATITAKKSGMLYLSIYETVYNAGNTGAYTVKISTGK